LVVKYLGNEKLSNTGSLISRIRIGSGFSDFVDPIRIGNLDPDPGARKSRNFMGKMHILVILKKCLPLKKYKTALTTF
jgi:hypothetical protein